MSKLRFTNLFFASVSAAIVSTFLLPQLADARPSTRSYSCERVKDIIHDRGAIVLNTKNSHVYRRFVSNRNYCAYRES
ncbi:MAG: hypothetical protein V3V04_04960, partial [Rhizobiaceae bacterium]